MAVGAFPGLDLNKRTVRASVNPLDKSTIVSIFPKHIREIKPTIQPGYFEIQPGSLEHPSLLVVGPSSWWKEIDDNQPLLEIPVSSIQIADSVVKDYCNGLLSVAMPHVMPGMFYVPGEFDLKGIREKYKTELINANVRQRAWYTALVRLADALWSNSNGNPIAINEDMRVAAKELGLVNKDWMADFRSLDMIRCVACGALRNPMYPICGTCHTVVDTEKAKELGIIPAPKPAESEGKK